MLGGILEGQQRTCFEAKTSRLNFFINFATGSPIITNNPDVFSVSTGIPGVWACEITKSFLEIISINAQYVVTGNITGSPAFQNITQVTLPIVSVNRLYNGTGDEVSTRFNYCFNNAATGALSAINGGVYFEVVMQNSTFGY